MKRNETFITPASLFFSLALLLALAASDSRADTRVWTGASSMDWGTAGNWNTGVPQAGDDVVITNAGNTVLLSSPTPMLNSLTISNKTLFFTNWTTMLNATNVTIQTGGVFTCTGPFATNQMSNLVYVVCTNLTIDPGGSIDVDGKGYKPEYGPGVGLDVNDWNSGAGHGGKGGSSGNSGSFGGSAYDSLTQPSVPGSGGATYTVNSGGPGGGVIRLDVAGLLTVNGTITANATLPTYASGGGAGGAIWITCGAFGGLTSGIIRAQGSRGDGNDPVGFGAAGGGGGGRIAVDYAALASTPGVRFQTTAGDGWRSNNWDFAWAHAAQMGTLYLPDTQMLSPLLADNHFRDVRLFLGVNRWDVDRLTVSNCAVIFAQEGFVLNVTNSIRVDQNAALGVGDPNSDTNQEMLLAGQDLILTNGARLYVYSGMTNSLGTNYGATVSVAGNMAVGPSSWVFPYSHQTNGGAVLFNVANLSVAATGGFNADGKGFMADLGPGKGYATGTGYEGGGGYGGRGGDGSSHGGTFGSSGGFPYGQVASPLDPGSGGASWPATNPRRGGAGGGVVRIVSAGTATVDGTLTANGCPLMGYASAAGAGGAVYLTCNTLAGTGGSIQAQGSRAFHDPTSCGGGGGGGRIALDFSAITGDPTIAMSVTGGIGYALFATPVDRRVAQMGTIWLAHTNPLPAMLTAGLKGNLQIPGFTAWSPDALNLTNSIVVFDDNFQLTVGGDLAVQTPGACLGLRTNSTLVVGGNLIFTNGGSGRFYGGPTNGAVGAYSTLITVTGTLSTATGSWVYVFGDATNGGAPLFRVGQLRVGAGGGFNANAMGFKEDSGPGFGPRGGSGYCGGAAHGGKGGNGVNSTYLGSTITYGSSNAPVTCGSGGGSFQFQAGSLGSVGGGAVRVEATGSAVVDGTIMANGSNTEYAAGGGAGGSIFISCASFSGAGSGLLSACGGNGDGTSSKGGGGGGGRIAVALGLDAASLANLYAGNPVAGLNAYNVHAPFAGTLTVTNGVGWTNFPPGGAAVGSQLYLSQSLLLSIAGSPATYDTPTPKGYGTHSDIPINSWVTNSVSSPVDQAFGARHTCIGWQVDVLDGGVATNDSNVVAVFQLTNNMTLTWKWTNQFEVAATSDSHGSVNSLTVDGWYNEGTVVTGIFATANGGYAFYQWSGDVPAGHEADNPLTVTMSQKRYVTANFVSNTGQENFWSGSNVWESVTNWSAGSMPSALDTVIVATGTVILTQPRTVASVIVSNGATIVFTNWNTSLTASNVTVLSGGALGLPQAFTNNQMTNRIYVICTNFTLEAGAYINADARGYLYDNGPGLGISGVSQWQAGSGHGGKGGSYSATVSSPGGGPTYDSITAPEMPGSGGASCSQASHYYGGLGGGIVRLNVTGTLTVNGTISANAVSFPGGGGNLGYASGGGAGGAIYLTCGTFGGTTTGLIRAQGSSGDYQDAANGAGGGGGGRIAVIYADLTVQHGVRFNAAAGARGWRSNDWDVAWMHAAEMGTLYLSDAALLSPVLENDLFRSVRIFLPTNVWAVDSLTLNHCGFIFGEQGFSLTVTNGVTLNDGMLGAGVVNASNLTQIAIGQNLVLTNGSRLYLCSGATNGSPDYGALLSVGGDVIVGTNSWIAPFAQETNGGAVKIEAANLTVFAGGGINADGKGFCHDQGPGKGQLHPTGWDGGAGYGGKGGQGAYSLAGTNYGSATNPIMPGSGGGSWNPLYTRNRGGYGGGVIRAAVPGSVTVNGTLTADGAMGDYASGGGSGGGIAVNCSVFGGSGVIHANGGNGDSAGMPSTSGGGGGGRIAVNYASLTGQPAVKCATLPGTGYNFSTPGDSRAAQMGSLYFPDTNLLTTNITTLSGYFMAPGFTAWAPASLTLSNASLGFVDGFQLNVAGAVKIAGTNGMLVVGTNSVLTCASLTLATNGQMRVYSAPTGGVAGAYGALVSVGGLMTVGGNTWIYPYADRTNGGAPLFRASRLVIETGGGFDADGAGLQDATGPGRGTNAPTGHAGGAGYGGRGGDGTGAVGGLPYGVSNAPVEAGSGGGNYNYISNLEIRYRGGYGGGVIRIDVENDAVMNGALRANGDDARNYAGGGAGGSILLAAGGHVDAGSESLMVAQGGDYDTTMANTAGGGGGGRIAIWYKVPDNERQRIIAGGTARVVVTNSYAHVLNTPLVAGGQGYQYGSNGTVVYLTVIPNPGTIFTIW